MKEKVFNLSYKNVKKSHNIKQNMDIYFERLSKILPAIINGCFPSKYETDRGFNNCNTCQSDYSVQFLDIAVCILHEDGIIDKTVKAKIMDKLYDGHRG